MMNHCSTNPLYTVITNLCDSCEILYKKRVWSLIIGLLSFLEKLPCKCNGRERGYKPHVCKKA